MIYNDYKEKVSVLLNNAGSETDNPILSGLPFQIRARFNNTAQNITAYAGSTKPPTTSIAFTQDLTDTLLYYHNAVAGTAPFNTSGENLVRVEFSATGEEMANVWQKNLYIQSLPTDAIQVYVVSGDDEGDWESVNFGTVPGYIPTVAMMCGVRFFNSWTDEFTIPRFGGCAYVSVFDYGSTDDGLEMQYVKRIDQKRIDEVEYIYLNKHLTSTVEQHDINFRFRSEEDSSTYVDVRVKLNSVSCWGFQLLDPITS